MKAKHMKPLRSPILVEGPDGGGKSTLVRNLSDTYKIAYEGSGGKVKDQHDFYRRLNEVELSPYKLFDRASHISNWVYAVALEYDPYRDLDYHHCRLRCWNPIVIHCRRASVEDHRENISKAIKAHKPSAYLDAVMENLDRIYRLYDIYFESLSEDKGVRVIQYDWATTSLATLVLQIESAQD